MRCIEIKIKHTKHGILCTAAHLSEYVNDHDFLTISRFTHVLRLYSEEEWMEFTESLMSQDYNVQRRVRPVFGFATRLNVYRKDQLYIPTHLAESASLQHTAYIFQAATGQRFIANYHQKSILEEYEISGIGPI